MTKFILYTGVDSEIKNSMGIDLIEYALQRAEITYRKELDCTNNIPILKDGEREYAGLPSILKYASEKARKAPDTETCRDIQSRVTEYCSNSFSLHQADRDLVRDHLASGCEPCVEHFVIELKLHGEEME